MSRATGNHLWADRYDGDLTDIFALQDEITKKVCPSDRAQAAEGRVPALPKPLAGGSWRLGHGDSRQLAVWTSRKFPKTG